MARPRKKKRTQAPGKVQNATAKGITKTNPADRTPQSMVLRMGASDVGPSVTQLVHDVRNVMEPHTAKHLRERRSNKLRDYTSMVGPLGVTHLLLFSRSASGNTNLRVAITPRGPTLHFRVERYSLCKDVTKSQRHPRSSGSGPDHLHPPLLVMNNFTTANPSDSAEKHPTKPAIPKHLETLTTSVFQSFFPPISPQRTPLKDIRRVLLLNRETQSSQDGTYTISLRHYAITSKPVVSLSRGIRRLRAAEKLAASRVRKPQPIEDGEGQATTPIDGTKRRKTGELPNMARLGDVADYILDPSGAGFTSASESEVDTDAEVEVFEHAARRVLNKRDKQRQRDAKMELDDTGAGADEAQSARGPRPQKRAIKLTELGPRMTLRLVKVEEGLCEGKVMWHEFLEKSEQEMKKMEMLWENRRHEREERRRVQRENLERKKKEAAANGKPGVEDGEDQGDAAEDMMDEDLEDEDWDDYDGDSVDDAPEEEMDVDEDGGGVEVNV